MASARLENSVSAQAIRNGDRRALARAITLTESTSAKARAASEELLTSLLPYTGSSIRIGISGAPGVGKSTLIEALGAHVTGMGRKLAVLAIDPSSRRSGGSILGDKTRMEQLARNPNAFIRPSPAGVALGGVARRTRDALLLVEAAGFDVVVVETVGVGQSETAVASMTDVFVLLIGPGAGDELQGLKRGVMELADIVLVTKADGNFQQAAARAAADYAHALHVMRPKYPSLAAQVLQVSVLEGRGLKEVWSAVHEFHSALRNSGELSSLRAQQLDIWFGQELEQILSEYLFEDPEIAQEAAQMRDRVLMGDLLPSAAARNLLHSFRVRTPLHRAAPPK
ncbi:MAG: methylmalonyl Co-A mutase-associated GTPase MeaB [Alphaproteobacteria bacterium]|nr:methylmalonyl Co-A mutase-associated GTPase MeaB [Alphaproteobacteria bacterium]MBV9064024.1 methylmalonyl Co-A mutase-associated GTPase MeaB [Alphaproteobacteria bacterium]